MLCVEWTEAELVHIQCSVQCVRLRTVLQCLERMRAVAVALPLPLCCRPSSTSALYQASSVQATAPLQSSWVLAIACTALSRAAIMAFQPPFSNAERLFPLHAGLGGGGHWPGLHVALFLARCRRLYDEAQYSGPGLLEMECLVPPYPETGGGGPGCWNKVSQLSG